MGTYIKEYGVLTIPDEKKRDFLADARQVAYQGGLFSRKLICLKDEQFIVLRFPSFENGDVANFSYSLFEKGSWEDAGIHLDDMTPYSEKIGWAQYNQVVQALYILAELYSTTPYFSLNDSLNRPQKTIQWLRYILGRDLEYNWRNDVWNVYETIALDIASRHKEPEVGMERMDDILVDGADYVGLINCAIVCYGTDKLLMNEDKQENVSQETSGASTMLSTGDFIRILKRHINQFKANTPLSEDEQIAALLRLLTCTSEERDEAKINEQYTGILLGLTFLTPQIAIKVISEIYGRNFWNLWWKVKDVLTVGIPEHLTNNEAKKDNKRLSTEAFLHITSDDRISWWRKGNDVQLSTETLSWLKDTALRFQKIVDNMGKATDTNWLNLLVMLCAHYEKIFFFEDLFYDFLENLHKTEYRAVLLLLDDVKNREEEFLKLIGVLANQHLRQEVFGF